MATSAYRRVPFREESEGGGISAPGGSASTSVLEREIARKLRANLRSLAHTVYTFSVRGFSGSHSALN